MTFGKAPARPQPATPVSDAHKIEDEQMSKDIESMFADAHRRICIGKRNSPPRILDNVWTGLAYPSHAKGMVAKGYMVPVFNESAGAMGWYKFTPEGWAEYNRRYANAPDYFDGLLPAVADVGTTTLPNEPTPELIDKLTHIIRNSAWGRDAVIQQYKSLLAVVSETHKENADA